MEVCERASGARMHTALYRPLEEDASVLTPGLLLDLTQFLTRCSRALAGAFLGLLGNRSLKSRLSGVGQMSSGVQLSYGLSGLLLRSGGRARDLRMQAALPYGLYRALTLRIFIGRRGDNFDRFLLRIKEAAESFRLLAQVLALLQPQGGRGAGVRAVGTRVKVWRRGSRCWRGGWVADGDAGALGRVYTKPHLRLQAEIGGAELGGLTLSPWAQRGKFSSMEHVIAHFRRASSGWSMHAGFSYQAVESPKGEVGVSLLVGSLGGRPSRVKLRTPVSHNMHLIPVVGVGATFADLVATFCSLDIVMGEIDR